MSAFAQIPDELLTLADMMAMARGSRASIYRDIERGLLQRRLGERGCAARWERRDIDARVERQPALRRLGAVER